MHVQNTCEISKIMNYDDNDVLHRCQCQDRQNVYKHHIQSTKPYLPSPLPHASISFRSTYSMSMNCIIGIILLAAIFKSTFNHNYATNVNLLLSFSTTWEIRGQRGNVNDNIYRCRGSFTIGN